VLLFSNDKRQLHAWRSEIIRRLAALRLQELLIEAVHQPQPVASLNAADAELDKLRTHLHLSLDLKLITPGQYAHVASMTTEVGRLLGGWKASLNKTKASRSHPPGADELLLQGQVD
jgi:hypothetical protein